MKAASLLSPGKVSSQTSQALRPDERGRRLTAPIRRFTAVSRARPRRAHDVPGVFSHQPRAHRALTPRFTDQWSHPNRTALHSRHFHPPSEQRTVLKFSPSCTFILKDPTSLPREPGATVFSPVKWLLPSISTSPRACLSSNTLSTSEGCESRCPFHFFFFF